jgi:hypothetical protein
MTRIWAGLFFMLALYYLAVRSVTTGYYWHWFGFSLRAQIVRFVLVLVAGTTLIRAIRAFSAIQGTKRKLWLLSFPLFPFHLAISMVFTCIVAIITMNRQGWITRMHAGTGGFRTKQAEA